MRNILSSIIVAAAAALALPPAAAAQDEPDNLDMSVSENMAVPAVPQKAHGYVTSTMDQLRRYFVRDGFAAEMTRGGEVLRLTVPCEKLFAPGAVELKPSAAAVLKPFATVVREPGRYKMLVAVHTDDTGDEVYSDSISAARANAIDDYLWQLADQAETNVIPYGLAHDEPLKPDDSLINRAVNRRVEFIIIPDKEILRAAGVKVK